MSADIIAKCAAGWIIAICCLPWPAHADSLSIRVEPPGADKRMASNPRWDVFLEGEFDVGSAERLEQELAPVGADGADVYLDSPGGSLRDGVRIGSLLRRLGATTTVGRRGTRGEGVEPGSCLSACSIAFLGGVYRYVPKGSVYGVHRASTIVHSDQDFEAGQIVAARVSSYIRDMGVDAGLFDRMASVGKDGIYVLNAAELHALRVVNDGKKPAEWWTELSTSGPRLVGTQQTADGAEKAVFRCDDGMLVFHSIYQAGSNSALIASGQWTHSLTVDGIAMPLDSPSRIEDADGYLNATFKLSPDLARRLIGATSVGHSMQGGRSDPTSLGYQMDIDGAAAKRVWGFIESCTASR